MNSKPTGAKHRFQTSILGGLMKNNRPKFLFFILIGLLIMSCSCGPAMENLVNRGSDFFNDYADDEYGYQQNGTVNNQDDYSSDDEYQDDYSDEYSDDSDNGAYTTDEQNYDDYESYDDYDESNNIVSYTLKNQTLSDPQYYDLKNDQYRSQQTDTALHQKLWLYATYVFPETYRKKIDQVIFFSDGRDNDLAMVEPVNEDVNTKWVLYIDIVDGTDTVEYTHTLVHELGHLITLSSDQINASDYSCDYDSEFGCFTQSSYLNVFIDKFWMDILSEWQDIEYNTTTQEDFDNQIMDFYDQYSDEFVSDYAPTSPEEDFCESWMYYVFKMQPDGGNIAKQKMKFFDNYPELTLLAKQIRTNLQ